MIAIIRIKGLVNVKGDIEETLYRLRLRKKYSCVLIKDKDKTLLEAIKNKIAFGEINNETLIMLLSKRGRRIGDKPISESADIMAKKIEEGKSLDELKIKPFFRLQPPRGGFKKSTKLLYPRGVLGENKDINELVRRML